jgi:predicted amidohydrolase
MKVAVAQYAASLDKADNLERLTSLVKQAAADGADLVVAPEGAMHDFGPQELVLGQFSEALDGEFVTGLSKVASECRVAVVAGMFEAIDGEPDRAYNTVVALGSDGSLAGSYRKQHLFDALGWLESQRLLPGEPDQRLVFDCCDLCVGVLTCYDIRFPELARALIDDGATMLVVPAAWVAGPHKPEQFRALATARAIENVCYVAAAVQTPPTYTGESCIIDPFGEVVASLDSDEGVVVGDLSSERLEECRAKMPSLEHRQWTVQPRQD